MSFKMSILGLAFVMVAAMATTVEAQRSYSLTGNSRGQIGDGLPIPIGFTPAPNGKIPAIPGARVTQSSGPDPKQMSFKAHQLKYNDADFNLPVFLFNSAVFQVKTNVSISWPAPIPSGPNGTGMTFMAGGRTGASTVTWCPGQAITPSGNPACTDPGTGAPGLHAIDGFLKYTKTANQFGGPIRGNAGGTADVGLKGPVPSPPLPCDHAQPAGPGGSPCVVAFALATPRPTGEIGGPFKTAGATTAGAGPPAPGGLRNAKVAANGEVLSVTSPGIGPGLANPATNFGGPYTTGMVTINQSGALASPEVFVATGSDNRVNGIGTISLVAGGLSDRALSGPNANRAWLNFTVAGDTPGLSSWGVGLVAVMLGSAGVWRARRATTKS